MSDAVALSRRKFLYGAAFTGAAAMLSACSGSGGESSGGGGHSSGGKASEAGSGNAEKKPGSSVEPLAAPARFFESPAVKNGSLPPVEKRIPQRPLVVPHH